MTYYEYRLREIEEQLAMLRCKPELVGDKIRELEQERKLILSEVVRE